MPEFSEATWNALVWIVGGGMLTFLTFAFAEFASDLIDWLRDALGF